LKNRNAGMVFIFITMLIDVLGFGLVVPVMPKLITQLAHTGVSGGAHYYGLLLSSYGLMQFLFAPFLGSLSDRYGRRPVLLASLFFNMIDYLILSFAPDVSWLFIGRILSGITGASFTVATAYIADVSPPEKKAQNFGMVGAAFGIGFILGPAAGGLFGLISLRAPFYAASALSLLNCLYGAFVVPESLAVENRRQISPEAMNPIKGLGILARFPWVLAMSASLILTNLAQSALQSTWVLYTTERYSWKPLDNGLSLALIGLMTAIVQVGLTRTLVPKLGERKAILIGMTFNFIGFLGIALASHGWMLYIVLVFWCLNGIAGPSIQSLLSEQYEKNEQGAVQGALTSLQSLTGIVGPLIATSIFAYFTAKSSAYHIPGAPFFFGAILIFISTFLAVGAMRKHKAEEELPSGVDTDGKQESLSL
jgi:DHA1 family tetracycline resistance protein-like MFS transporter